MSQSKPFFFYAALYFLAVAIIAFLALMDRKITINHQLTEKIHQEILQTQISPVQEALVKFFKIYSAYDKNGPLKLIRHGKDNDGGYVVATKAFEYADALLGYGISNDSSFEEQFSLTYNKPSYGFDCSIEQINSKNNLFTHLKECIATDAFLYNKSNKNHILSSFDQQLNKLNFKDKKLFIKMDIEGAEYHAFPDILKHHHNITGIVLEIHFNDTASTKKAIELLKQLERNFVLLHVHGNNHAINSGFSTTHSIGVIPTVVELTYIHKSLITNYELAIDQSHPLKIDQPNNPNLPDAVFTILE